MRKFINILALTTTFFIILACKNERYKSFGEKQFDISFGTLPNQIFPTINKFEKSSFDIKTYNGLVYVLERKTNKLMIFNSYGKLIQAYQNGAFTTDFNFKIKKIDFEDLQEVYPSKDFIIAVDKLDSNKADFDQQENIAYFNRILILNKNSSVEMLGQEGINGKPFPKIYDVTVDDNNQISVNTISKDGYVVYSYDNNFNPLYKIYVNKSILNLTDDNKKYNTIDKVFFDINRKTLYVKTTKFEKVSDNENINELGEVIKNQYLYTMSLKQNKEFEINSIIILPQNFLEDKQESFINIISIYGNNILATTNSKNLSGIVLWKLNNKGEIVSEMDLAEPQGLLLLSESVSKDGILSILYESKNGVSVYWWNLNKLLNL